MRWELMCENDLHHQLLILLDPTHCLLLATVHDDLTVVSSQRTIIETTCSGYFKKKKYILLHV
jgi:hypothetical protein